MKNNMYKKRDENVKLDRLSFWTENPRLLEFTRGRTDNTSDDIKKLFLEKKKYRPL